MESFNKILKSRWGCKWTNVKNKQACRTTIKNCGHGLHTCVGRHYTPVGFSKNAVAPHTNSSVLLTIFEYTSEEIGSATENGSRLELFYTLGLFTSRQRTAKPCLYNKSSMVHCKVHCCVNA